MASDVWIKTGSFVTPASGTTVLDVTSKGTNPKAIVLWGTFNTANQTAQAHSHMGLGFSDGSNHASILHNAENPNDNTRTDRDSAASYFISDPADDSIDVVLTAAMNVNDVTLSYSSFTAGHIIHFMIFGGVDCSAFVGSVGSNASNSPVTGVGFTSDLILAHTHGLAGNIAGSQAFQSFGAAHDNGTTIDQWGLFTHFGNDASGDRGAVLTSTFGVVGQLDVAVANWVAEILTITSDGFTFDNQGGGTGGVDVWSFLCLSFSGHPVDVGTFVKNTDAGPVTQALPDLGFTPQAYWLSSAHEVATDIGTGNGGRVGHGAFDGVDQHSALATAVDGDSSKNEEFSDNAEVLVLSDDIQGDGITTSGTAQAITDSTPDVEWNPNSGDNVQIGFFALAKITNITLVANAGVYVFAGQDVAFAITMPVGAGAYVYNGQDVTTSKAVPLDANAGVYALTGGDAVLAFSMPVDAGAYAYAGQDIAFALVMPVVAGAYAYAGQDIAFAIVMPVNAGVYAYAGQDVTLGTTMPADSGAYAHAGQDITFSLVMPVGAGVYAYAGQDVVTNQGQFIFVAAGVYTYAGQDVAFAITMPVVAGAYTFAGQDVATTRGFESPVDAGAYTFAGQDITFDLTMPVNAGVYTYAGQNVTSFRGISLSVDAGVYAYAGQDANFITTMPADPGVYSFAGQDVMLLINEVLVANVGSYSFLGSQVVFGITMPVDVGVYVWEGQDASTEEEGIDANTGSFVFTGQDALIFKGPISLVDLQLTVEVDTSVALTVEVSPNTT